MSATSRRGLRLGVIEPHLQRYGGVRRMVEFANRLTDRGHRVTIYVPDIEPRRCTWMPCRAEIRHLSSGYDDELDVLVFNDEPQWYLLERFRRARHRVYYALHYSALYGKRSSWEALRAEVDLQLANSTWTADQVEAETGHRPEVVLSGIDRSIFAPHDGPRNVEVLCTGDRRDWKGTDTIRAAAERLGVPLTTYADRGLDQPALGREYAAARQFVVGSWFEGFGQPGLEALACGTPLVTTDNGGCREYAVDGETALVVPPRDVGAMADAMARLREDPELAARLVVNGLDVVATTFDWERRTDDLEAILDGVAAGTMAAPPPPRPVPSPSPTLSVVVLAWGNLAHTQRCVESVRRHTDVDHELIVIDNGSGPDAADYARLAADRAVLNPENLGFSRGMNQGLEVARGEYVAFCNNDIVLPPTWASKLVETASTRPRAGIVVPAVTAAGNPVSVRAKPGDDVITLAPFSPPPSGVVYLMRCDVIRALEGWSEHYPVASGEDVDLAFKVWVNDLDIVVDERVLVDHVGKASAARLDDWQGLWARNRRLLLDRWQGDEAASPRLASCEPVRFDRNRATARAVAGWMDRFFTARDQARRRIPSPHRVGAAVAGRARRWWHRHGADLPGPAARTARAARERLRRFAPSRGGDQ
ncbi:MAG TPA: glycosyltransferase [Acidimicrobiales bacterium]